VRFDGESVLGLEPEERARRGIFLSFQHPVEIPGVSTSVFLKAAVNAVRRARGEAELDAAAFLRLAREKMALVEMDKDLLHRSLNEGFSGGEKKRNEVFQMAVLEPRLCVLDEPDSGSTWTPCGSSPPGSRRCGRPTGRCSSSPTTSGCSTTSGPTRRTCSSTGGSCARVGPSSRRRSRPAATSGCATRPVMTLAEALATVELPAGADEAWKYTRPDLLLDAPFAVPAAPRVIPDDDRRPRGSGRTPRVGRRRARPRAEPVAGRVVRRAGDGPRRRRAGSTR
jgi:hypothetical protein